MTIDLKTQALVAAVKRTVPILRDKGLTGTANQLDDALVAFAPEPEMEYVLPEWENPPKWIEYWMRNCSISRLEYNELRNLTRRPVKAKGREWEPQFEAMAPEQEQLAIKFCQEIAGLKGTRGSPPDPVRLLEMAQALYDAERKWHVREVLENETP